MLQFKVTLSLFCLALVKLSVTQENVRYRRAVDDGQYHPDNEGQYIPDDSGKYVHQDVKYVHDQIDPLKYIHQQQDPVKYIHDDRKYFDKDGRYDAYARVDKDGRYDAYARVDKDGRYDAYARVDKDGRSDSDKYTIGIERDGGIEKFKFGQGGVGTFVTTELKQSQNSKGTPISGSTLEAIIPFFAIGTRGNLQTDKNSFEIAGREKAGKSYSVSTQVDQKFTTGGSKIQTNANANQGQYEGGKVVTFQIPTYFANTNAGRNVLVESNSRSNFGTGTASQYGTQKYVNVNVNPQTNNLLDNFVTVSKFTYPETSKSNVKNTQSDYGYYGSGVGGKYVHQDTGKHVRIDEKYKTTGTAYGGSGVSFGSDLPTFFSTDNKVATKGFENTKNFGIAIPNVPVGVTAGKTVFTSGQSSFDTSGRYYHDDSGRYVDDGNGKYVDSQGDGKYAVGSRFSYTGGDDKSAKVGVTETTYASKIPAFVHQGFVYQKDAVTPPPVVPLFEGVQKPSGRGFSFETSKQSTQYSNTGTGTNDGFVVSIPKVEPFKVNVDGQNARINVQTETGKINTVIPQLSTYFTESRSGGKSELSQSNVGKVGIPEIPNTSQAFNIGTSTQTVIPGFFQTSGTGNTAEKGKSYAIIEERKIVSPVQQLLTVKTPTIVNRYSSSVETSSNVGQFPNTFSFGQSTTGGDVQYKEFGAKTQGGVNTGNFQIGTVLVTQDICDNAQWKDHKHICIKLKATCFINADRGACNNKDSFCNQMISSIMSALYELNALK